MRTLAIFLLVVVIALGYGVPAGALTVSNDTSYYTDFSSLQESDFCDASVMGYTFLSTNINTSPWNANAAVTNIDGVMRFKVNYGLDACKALIQGGSQTQALVQIGVDLSTNSIMSKAYGLFSNTYAEMTFTYYGCTADNYTNLPVYLSVRKTAAPYEWRKPSYLVKYNGQRFSIMEWTYRYEEPDPREITGVDVGIGNVTNLLKMVINCQGGDDNGGANGTPVLLTGELWDNGVKTASISGQDNPYNWVTGPEVPGSVYNPAGDYNFGTWSPYAHDWTSYASWGRGGRDIHNAGWVVIAVRQLASLGNQGIDVTELYVGADAPVQSGAIFLFQ